MTPIKSLRKDMKNNEYFTPSNRPVVLRGCFSRISETQQLKEGEESLSAGGVGRDLIVHCLFASAFKSVVLLF